MKKTYSAWARKGKKEAHCFKQGEGPTQFGNGEYDKDCEVRLYTIEAHSWEEAMAIYYIRQGWEPYKPVGEAAPCPECGFMFYPAGSGQCWQCDFIY
tara:strand:+ start:18872 stop:19162 length:291 start_codon:yes stop_codon:yes gene_type:complete